MTTTETAPDLPVPPQRAALVEVISTHTSEPTVYAVISATTRNLLTSTFVGVPVHPEEKFEAPTAVPLGTRDPVTSGHILADFPTVLFTTDITKDLGELSMNTRQRLTEAVSIAFGA